MNVINANQPATIPRAINAIYRMEEVPQRSDTEAMAIVNRLYTERINGVSHRELTDTAFAILESNLISYGNTLSNGHREALYELIGHYTKVIQGTISGRLAFGLDTGMGKTESVVALITAIHRLELDHVSVLVCQSKVEGLCELKRKLITMEVPESAIGLIHSYGFDEAKLDSSGKASAEGFASLPCTPRHEHRQFQLVTHNRVRGGGDLTYFNTYQDKPRTLAIWDESLLISETLSITEQDLRKAVHNFGVDYERYDTHKGLRAYLEQALSDIRIELEAQRGGGRAKPLRLAELDAETQRLYLALIDHDQMTEDRNRQTLNALLEMSSQELRLLSTHQGDGLISYRISVPPELRNVIVLDASWWIRELEKLDTSIRSVSKFIRPNLKKYDKVTIHQMPSHGGRHSLTQDLGGKREQRKTSKELAAAIKAIPDTEGVLIFTYKQRGGGVDFVKTLRADLAALGIDTESTVDVSRSGIITQQPRINFLTWGSETSLNEYSYCSNLILAGIMHRSHVDIAAAITGQKDSLVADIRHEDIRRVMDSEIAHLAFQALSRGTCRKVSNGYAEPMKAWVIHSGLELKPLLERVMSGVKWRLWEEVDPNNEGVITKTAIKILAWLDGQDDKVSRIATSRLKKELAMKGVSSTSWTTALNKAVSQTGKWTLQGRSVVRVSGFSTYFN